MKVPVLVALFLFAFVGYAKADDATPPHQHTTSPTNARYEIVQSELAARWTFKLDRFSGQIWQIVTNKDGDLVWEEMPVEKLAIQQGAGHAHYQIFLSSLAAKFSFLIDTDTGTTWQLAHHVGKAPDQSDDYSFWQKL